MSIWHKLFYNSPARYVVAFVSAMALTVIALFTRGYGSISLIADAISIGGAVTLLAGLLCLVSYYGAFDTIAYGFSTIVGNKRRYEDLYEFTQGRIEQHRSQPLTFMPPILVGLLFIVVSVVLFVLA